VRVISTDVADAEALPYPDGRFDAAVTIFGAMFADRPERVVSELVRVTRPGGLVAMASWRSRGFFGGLLRTHTALLPPRPGVLQPLTLGDPDVVRGLLGERVATLISTRRTLALRFPLPPAATGELFAAWHEPTVAALRAGDSCGGLRLRAELARLITRHNRAVDGTTLLAGEYLEVQARLA
jgi:SAM-dependent methyltransferase